MLDASQKKRCAILLLVFLVSSIFQVAGVASIAPFVALLANPNLIHSNKWLNLAYELGAFQSDRSFLIAFATLVIITTILSNAVGALTTRLSVHAAFSVGAAFQRHMYRGYLFQDFAQSVATNSADLMSALSQETGRFLYMVLNPLINLVSYIFVAATVVALLIAVDPVAAIAVSALIGTAYAITYQLSTDRLAFHGERVGQIYEQRFRLMSESLGGLKEIKLLGTEAHYDSKFGRLNDDFQESNATIVLLGDLPRFFLEAAAFSALMGLAIYLLLQGEGANSVVAVLSLYAMAGYRLLPVAQNILRCVSSIKANSGVVAILAPHICAGQQVRAANSTSDRAEALPLGPIEVERVFYTYPGAATPALRDVSLTIPSNAITVLVGSSGAGKSTLADVLLGLLRPSAGTLKVGAHSIDNTNIRMWQRNLGYVPQSIYLLDASIAANIGMGSPTELSMDRVQRAARLARLDKFIDSLPNRYHQVTGERGGLLSGGQRQRVGIARALYHDANVLIMDEATSALDSVTENAILESLRSLRNEKTIVLVAHRLSTIQAADWVVFMKDGRVAGQGTFRDLATTSTDFRELVAAAQHAGAEDSD